jgi:hypothetical protein
MLMAIPTMFKAFYRADMRIRHEMGRTFQFVLPGELSEKLAVYFLEKINHKQS